MKKLRQIVAWLSILLIAGLIIGTVICGITGSRYFFGMLFLALCVPVVLWVFMWFTRLIHGDSKVIPKEDMEALDKQKQSEQQEKAIKVKQKEDRKEEIRFEIKDDEN